MFQSRAENIWHSMTQERMDAMKLDFIAHRSEKGREAVEALRKSREEKLRKMAGIKDEPARIWGDEIVTGMD